MKRKPAQRQRLTWTNSATGEVIRLQLTHTADYISAGTDHLEIESVPKHVPHPLSQTGYRSHFIGQAKLKSAGSTAAFVTRWLDEVTKPKAHGDREAQQRQGDLFAWAARQTAVRSSARKRTRPAHVST